MMSLVETVNDFISGSKTKIVELEKENTRLKIQLDLANKANSVLEDKMKKIGDVEGELLIAAKVNRKLKKELEDAQNTNCVLESKIYELNDLEKQCTLYEKEREDTLDLILQTELESKEEEVEKDES